MTLSEKLTAYAHLMRLDKPVGTLLLAWSGLWGLWLAGDGQPPARIVFIVLLGTWTMRSAGCVFNDLADRRYDGHVARTRKRPLVSGKVAAGEALALGIALLAASFALVLLLNWQSVLLSLFCVFVALFYPFCKRFLLIPQAILGVAFASAILLAHTAILGHLTWACFWLFLASLFWALVYDTYYALVDRDDDIPLGLHSSAIFARGKERRFIAAACLLMLICLVVCGRLAKLNDWYYYGILIATAQMGYHLWRCRTLDRGRAFAAFTHNNWVGAAIFAGLVLAKLP